MLNGQQITNLIHIKALDMIFLAKCYNCYLEITIPNNLPLKYEHFLLPLYRLFIKKKRDVNVE